MIYVISDLHGYPLEKLKKLLEKADFGEDDFLYILGDVIDRNGDGGIGVLQWLLTQPNVELIMGNHEAMLLSCDFVLDMDTSIPIDDLDRKQLELLVNYTFNGGDVTLLNLRKLSNEQQDDIFDYLRDCPLYEAVTAGGKDYILVHAGFENFSKDRKISDYSPDELIWAEPELTDEYYDDIHTVFGHTPTKLFGDEYDGRIFKTPTWTCIDCGAAYGNEPILLRLDDYMEFKL
jgi:serine/threonine protein phosphatase 1